MATPIRPIPILTGEAAKRFVRMAVAAKNEEKPLHYYEKNDFVYLYSSEEQEADNLQLEMPLKTRFMFFDLIDLFEE